MVRNLVLKRKKRRNGKKCGFGGGLNRKKGSKGKVSISRVFTC